MKNTNDITQGIAITKHQSEREQRIRKSAVGVTILIMLIGLALWSVTSVIF